MGLRFGKYYLKMWVIKIGTFHFQIPILNYLSDLHSVRNCGIITNNWYLVIIAKNDEIFGDALKSKETRQG